MKKLLFILALFVSINCYADVPPKIRVFQHTDFQEDTLNIPWEQQTVAVGSEYTWTIDFKDHPPKGFGSLQITTSGTNSSALIVHKSSCNGKTYNTTIKNGTAMDDIVSAQTPGSYQYQWDMPFSRYFQISLTASGSELTIDEIAFNLQ